MIPRAVLLSAVMVFSFLLAGCGPPAFARRPQPELAKHLAAGPAETADLTEREYLMRKATLGSRAERMEALDVIDRANDPSLLPFLLERLKKEDDRFLKIGIMQILGNAGDVRAVPVLRGYARWDQTRVGIEATMALYELGDDSLMPALIMKLRPNEDYPELAGIAYRALKKMTDAELPPSMRAWMTYYRSHRLAPYESRAWFWPMEAPLPPTVEGTTKVVPHPKGRLPLPQENLRIRRTSITWQDFWKPDEP